GVIIATLHDYAVIRQLMADLLASAVELKMRQQVADTVEAVKGFFAAPWKGDERDTQGASTAQVAEILKLDMNTAWRRLRAAEEARFVVNLEHRRNRPGRYRLSGDSLSESDGALLPTADELQQALQEARRAWERARSREQQTRASKA